MFKGRYFAFYCRMGIAAGLFAAFFVPGAQAEVLTLICEISGWPESRATLDIDLDRRTLYFATAPQPRTVRVDITERYFTFTSPYTNAPSRIDRRTGESGGGGYHSVGTCSRAGRAF